jgi:hypothetical protein
MNGGIDDTPNVRDPAAQPTGSVTNHHRRHRRTLSRRDSLLKEIGESLKQAPLDNVAQEAESQTLDDTLSPTSVSHEI